MSGKITKELSKHVFLNKQIRKKATEIVTLLERLEAIEEEFNDLCETTEGVRRFIKEAFDKPRYREELTERDKKIIAYRQEGYTLKEIAPKIGMTYGSLKHISARLNRMTTKIDNCIIRDD